MKNDNKKLIAEIVPAVKLPRNVTRVFSYVVPDKFEKKIEVGMLVEVFFRNKKIIGVVYNLKKEELDKTGYKLKNIEKILDSSVNLSKEQIALAEYVSSYYYVPISLVIKTIIPPITKKEARKEIELRAFSRREQACLFPTERLLKEIEKKNKILLIHNLQAERHSLYFDLIKNTLKKNEQALILLPESFDVYNFANFYMDNYHENIKNNIPSNSPHPSPLPKERELKNIAMSKINIKNCNKVAILTSELTKNQYFDEWKKIKNGSARIIIGTRQAVFAPFQNLRLIIADDEHNSSYKQWDMNPRYHGIKTAEKLAELWKAKIILSSPAPSVRNYYEVKSKLYFQNGDAPHHNPLLRGGGARSPFQKKRGGDFVDMTTTTPSPSFAKEGRNISLVDSNAERQKKNYSVLSEDLQDGLLENIYERKQAVIFIPRLGNNTITQCRDCHWIAQCKNCETTLVSYGNYLYCQKCREKIELIKKCPKCQGQNISSFGYGSEKIEEEIKKLFANKNIKIARLDSDTASNKSKQVKIYKDFINKKIDILIGTQMVLKNWNLENLALTAILFPEIIFNQPDFRSKEKSFQFLISLRDRVSENHRVIIQTHKPDNDLFKIIKNNNLEKFYSDEIENRKAISKNKIGYPPFSQLIKLIYKDFNSQNCKDEAERMFRALDSKIKNDKNLKNKFEIIKPFPASSYKEFNKYRWHIIVKSVCADIEPRNSLLNLVKKNWIIDVDPDNIL